MAEVSGDRLTRDVADVPTQVSHMSRLMTVVGAKGFDPPCPTPQIVVPDWIGEALQATG